MTTNGTTAPRRTLRDLRTRYEQGDRLTMVTAYDHASARLIDRTTIELVLVGDSLGMTMQGHDSTVPVTLDDICYHTRAVVRGCRQALIVADLPFLTYGTPAEALASARRLMQQGGAQSVKLEGGRTVVDVVRALVSHGVPVMGHLGFTPQSIHQIGVRVQGKDVAMARQLVEDALALQAAGAWAIVLELIPAALAAEITRRLAIPTIGIGAGPDCSGEVQVWHDILGLDDDFRPRHSHRFRSVGDDIVAGLREFDEAVRARTFPTAAHSSRIEPDSLAAALDGLPDPGAQR